MLNKYILLIFLGLGLATTVILLTLYLSSKKSGGVVNGDNKVISSIPKNGDTAISDDAQITLQFAKPVPNGSILNVTFSPALPFDKYSITSTFPSQTVKIKPTGLLANNTVYKVVVNYQDKPIYAFAFQTIVQQQTQTDPESIKQADDQALKYYPLSKQMPYISNNVSADYYQPFKIKVVIKNGTEADARKEVESWMKRNGVDPSTHQLTFMR